MCHCWYRAYRVDLLVAVLRLQEENIEEEGAGKNPKDLSTDGLQISVLSAPLTGDVNLDNLKLAIGPLQAISDEQGMSVSGSSGEPLAVKAEMVRRLCATKISGKRREGYQ